MAIKTTQTPSEHASTLSALQTLRHIDVSIIATLTAVTLFRAFAREKGQIGTIRWGLAVGGTVSDGAFEIRKNGVMIHAAAAVLANGQTDPTNTYTLVPATEDLGGVVDGDLIEVVATSVPTGASGLTISIPIARRFD